MVKQNKGTKGTKIFQPSQEDLEKDSYAEVASQMQKHEAARAKSLSHHK